MNQKTSIDELIAKRHKGTHLRVNFDTAQQ
jgi:hypothetical protein